MTREAGQLFPRRPFSSFSQPRLTKITPFPKERFPTSHLDSVFKSEVVVDV